MYSHLKVDIAWGPGHDISPLIQPEGHDQCHHHHLHDAIRRKPPSSQLTKCLGLICRITCGLDTEDFFIKTHKNLLIWIFLQKLIFFKVMGLVMGLSWGQSLGYRGVSHGDDVSCVLLDQVKHVPCQAQQHRCNGAGGLGESALSRDRDCLHPARPFHILFQPQHREWEYRHQRGAGEVEARLFGSSLTSG